VLSQVRIGQCGWNIGQVGAQRVGLVAADRIGSVTPQSAAIAGSSQATPARRRVVVAVDQVGDGHVGERGEAVGHTGRDVDAEVVVLAAVGLGRGRW
jgi:hypothetical protein